GPLGMIVFERNKFFENRAPGLLRTPDISLVPSTRSSSKFRHCPEPTPFPDLVGMRINYETIEPVLSCDDSFHAMSRSRRCSSASRSEDFAKAWARRMAIKQPF